MRCRDASRLCGKQWHHETDDKRGKMQKDHTNSPAGLEASRIAFADDAAG